jgi:S1-C subfamily serine protease
MAAEPHDPRAAPRFSCSPWALLSIATLFAYAFLANGGLFEPQRRARQRDAVERAVAERGELAAHEQHTIALFRDASRSVVNIMNLERRLSRDFFQMRATEVPQGTGSGFVWDEDGHVVTNYHVVHNASRIVVTLADRSEWDAEVVGLAPDFDLAVVRIDAPEEKLPPLPLGTSSDLLVGQSVYAIGNPFGLDQTLTTGVISGLHRQILSLSQFAIEDVIQTDAAINPGNSGGPLLDSSGRLIGVNAAIYSPSGASAGIGFAVPVDTVARVVPELIANGRFVRPTLGVYMAPVEWARELGVEGVLVREVVPGSGAARAGLRPLEVERDGRWRGDVIVAIGGKPIRRPDDILHVLSTYREGDEVQVEVERAGERETLSVQLSGVR